jgi:predicted murein hydrolase (TIGR00659 family)
MEALRTPYFGIALSEMAYLLASWLRKKTKLALLNPLLVADILVIAALVLLKIPYEEYNAGGRLIDLFLMPATVSLAVSIYAKFDLLKKNLLPILVGCAAGSVTSLISVYALCRLFGLDEAVTFSMLPKSVTTPIALSISAAHSGIAPITVIAVLFTGIFGSVVSPYLIRLFRVRDPLAAGLAIGASCHAIGTSKALEIGETEGAMSGLAIGISGLITVLLSLAFYPLIGG